MKPLSEVVPGLLVILIQIQAVCLRHMSAKIPPKLQLSIMCLPITALAAARLPDQTLASLTSN